MKAETDMNAESLWAWMWWQTLDLLCFNSMTSQLSESIVLQQIQTHVTGLVT